MAEAKGFFFGDICWQTPGVVDSLRTPAFPDATACDMLSLTFDAEPYTESTVISEASIHQTVPVGYENRWTRYETTKK